MQHMSLPETVMATVPQPIDAEDVLPGAVRGSQLDRSRRSGWPVQEGKSQWTQQATGLQLQLHHTAEDEARPAALCGGRDGCAAVPPGLSIHG